MVLDVINLSYALFSDELSNVVIAYLRTKLANKIIESLSEGDKLIVAIPLTDEGRRQLFNTVLDMVENEIRALSDSIKRRDFRSLRNAVLNPRFVNQEMVLFLFQSTHLRRKAAKVDNYVEVKSIENTELLHEILEFCKNRRLNVDRDVVRYVVYTVKAMEIKNSVRIEFVTREKHGDLCKDIENRDLINNILRMYGVKVDIVESKCNIVSRDP